MAKLYLLRSLDIFISIILFQLIVVCVSLLAQDKLQSQSSSPLATTLLLKGRNSNESRWLRKQQQQFQLASNNIATTTIDQNTPTLIPVILNNNSTGLEQEKAESEFVDPEKQKEYEELKNTGNVTLLNEMIENEFPEKKTRNIQFDPQYPKKISYGVVVGIIAGLVALLLGAIKLCVYCVKNDPYVD